MELAPNNYFSSLVISDYFKSVVISILIIFPHLFCLKLSEICMFYQIWYHVKLKNLLLYYFKFFLQ